VKGDLERLIAAVEAGDFDASNIRPARFNAFIDACEVTLPQDVRGLTTAAWQAYNGSLDAALRLHEALLPGWGWAVDWRDDGFVMAWLSPNLNRMPEAERAAAPLVDERNYSGKPARAWLLAILRAMAKREEG
jgi:hypothetical protein